MMTVCATTQFQIIVVLSSRYNNTPGVSEAVVIEKGGRKEGKRKEARVGVSRTFGAGGYCRGGRGNRGKEKRGTGAWLKRIRVGRRGGGVGAFRMGRLLLSDEGRVGGGGGAGDVAVLVGGGASSTVTLDTSHGVVAVASGGVVGVHDDSGSSFIDDGNFWKALSANQTSEEIIPSGILYAGGVVMLLATVAGLCGNLVILAALWNRKNMKNIINIFVTSLCINDLMNLLLNNAMVTVSYFFRSWPSNLLHCESLAHFTVLLMGCSLWHTGLIAVHRFLVVVCNQFYMTMSKNIYTAFVLTFSRVVPLCFLLNPDLGNMVKYEPKLLRCLIKEEFVLFKTLVSVVLMIIPSILVIICYVAIFIKSYIASAALRSSQNSEWLRREIQITKMFGIVFLVIYVGYIPYGIIRSIDRQLKYSGSVYAVITVLYAVANTVNPLIYGAMDKRIYRACVNMFCTSKRQVQIQEQVQLHSQRNELADTGLNNIKETKNISTC
ncbi:melatonin receptor type 1A-like [Octopus sinensis]|uniref:Melatonin receptor type 1A-like n=1 Tax=Octopus sinensis TaxID=2607531 RepID=A0A6P7TSJ5_9MOLL|nr:melatonin receptor type 1A-like [Octopus sinensis]